MKKLVIIKGDHNSWRPAQAYTEVSDWLYRVFLNEQEREALGTGTFPMQIASKISGAAFFLCRVRCLSFLPQYAPAC